MTISPSQEATDSQSHPAENDYWRLDDIRSCHLSQINIRAYTSHSRLPRCQKYPDFQTVGLWCLGIDFVRIHESRLAASLFVSRGDLRPRKDQCFRTCVRPALSWSSSNSSEIFLSTVGEKGPKFVSLHFGGDFVLESLSDVRETSAECPKCDVRRSAVSGLICNGYPAR